MASDEAPMAAGLARVQGNFPRTDGHGISALIAAGSYRDALARCAEVYASALGRLCMAFTGSQAESEELVQEIAMALPLPQMVMRVDDGQLGFEDRLGRRLGEPRVVGGANASVAGRRSGLAHVSACGGRRPARANGRGARSCSTAGSASWTQDDGSSSTAR